MTTATQELSFFDEKDVFPSLLKKFLKDGEHADYMKVFEIVCF